MAVLRFGLLGASWIGEHAIIAPAKDRSDALVSAVAARDPERAAAWAAKHGIPGVARDYATLIARDDVDVVYIGLTPSAHCEWAIRALEAGKHVLCEKPFAMNADEAKRMVDAATANGRRLIEAWHYRFHPLMLRVRSIVESGVLGRLRHARAQFFAPIPNVTTEFRWQSALGGGALMDTGGYTIHVLRMLLGGEPRVLEASSETYLDIDLTTHACLAFGDDLVAEIECSMVSRDLFSELKLEGETGTLIVHGFPLPQWGCDLRLETRDGVIKETPAGGTTYEAQLAHVVDVFAGLTPQVTGGDDAIGNMRVIDAINAARQ